MNNLEEKNFPHETYENIRVETEEEKDGDETEGEKEGVDTGGRKRV